jgi:hypothetical protein
MFNGVSVCRVVFHLGAEDAAQADQQFGCIGHRTHAWQQQEAAALGQRVRQCIRFVFGGADESLRAGIADQPEATAETGARQGSDEFETAAHGAPAFDGMTDAASVTVRCARSIYLHAQQARARPFVMITKLLVSAQNHSFPRSRLQYQGSLMMTYALPRLSWPGHARP